MSHRSKHSSAVEDRTIIYHRARNTLTPTEVASLLLWLNLKITSQFDIDAIRLKQKISPYVYDKGMNRFEEDGEYVCVGSQADGTGINSSDADFMYCLDGFLCYEINSRDEVDFNSPCTLVADRRFVPDGYTMLWKLNDYVPTMATVDKISWKPSDILRGKYKSKVLVSHGKKRTKVQFRKCIFDNSLINIFTDSPVVQTRGPAWSLRMQIRIKNKLLIEQFDDIGVEDYTTSNGEFCTKLDMDIAFAIEFNSKDVIQSWIRRKRRYNWPSKQLIMEVSEIPGYVVCTGKKGSEFERYEWRISHALAECALVRSLNEVQTLMLIYLKVFFCGQNKSVFPDCTSYILKNFILWLSESVQPSYFRRENFLPLLLSTVTVLSRCVEKNRLPRYMMPKSNIFQGNIDHVQHRRRIISRLKWIIESRALFGFKIEDMVGLYISVRKGDTAACIAQHQKAVKIYQTVLFLIKYYIDNDQSRVFLLFVLRLLGLTFSFMSVASKYVA